MHIGNAGQIGKIKNTLMRLAVTAHQTCPVNRKYNRKILNTYIMYNLVIGTLQKRGINSNHRF